jgi:ORF6N domain
VCELRTSLSRPVSHPALWSVDDAYGIVVVERIMPQTTPARAGRLQRIRIETTVERAVLRIRGRNVLLDADLAGLYGVKAKALNQAVKRNIARFPGDFMFQLTTEEVRSLRSQIVTLKNGRGRHAKYHPRAFTEQGVAMLSSVLRSPRAVRVNIEIMRTFVQLRRAVGANAELATKIDELEAKYDSQFTIVFEAIRELMTPICRPRRPIGFRATR